MAISSFRQLRLLPSWLYSHNPWRAEFDSYLSVCKGVVHVGANVGQEQDLYDLHGLNVVWIEPIPAAFAALQVNISNRPNHHAIKALIADKDGDELLLHVANNDGLSSSIFDLHKHKDMWPEIEYVADLPMKTSTLPIALTGLDLSLYDALVLDTQGSELLVLRGAAPILRLFKFIKIEAADFEAYRGCATVKDIDLFLTAHGFRLRRKEVAAKHPAGLKYFELLYSPHFVLR